MSHKLMLYVAAASLGLFPHLADAGIVTYASRAAWTAALPQPVNVTMDFNMFAADHSFAVDPANVGPFTLHAYNAAGVTEMIDAAPFLNPGDANIDGTTYAFIFVDGTAGITVILRFAEPTMAFGADFQYPGNDVQLIMDVGYKTGEETPVVVPGTGTSLEFFGIVSTEPFCGVRFRSSVNDGFGLDNVEALRVTSLPTEPTTWGKVKALYR